MAKSGTPTRPQQWEMNRAGDAGEIFVYQDIGGYDHATDRCFGAQEFMDQLAQLGNVATLDVRINCLGGLCSEAVAIYQALSRHPATKRVWVDAACYSAATIVAMAASPGELRIAFNARMMIHPAWVYPMMMNRHEGAKIVEALRLLDGTIAATYAKRSSVNSKESWLALMDEETWYDAEGAVAAGLADEIFQGDEESSLPDEAANRLRHYKNVPRDLVDRLAARSQKVDGQKSGEERGARSESQQSEEARGARSEKDVTDVSVAVDVDARWAEVRGREVT